MVFYLDLYVEGDLLIVVDHVTQFRKCDHTSFSLNALGQSKYCVLTFTLGILREALYI